MSLTERQIAQVLYRKKALPDQLRRAYGRVGQLRREAMQFGSEELLKDLEQLDRAWEREIELARIEGEANGSNR